MMKRSMVSAVALAALACGAAQAQVTEKVVDVNSATFKDKVEQTRAETPLLVTKETVGSNLSPEERQRLEALAAQVTDKTMQRYESDEAKKYQAQAMDMKRRADDIADEAMSSQREKVLKFLGVDAQSNANLYYFVSFSMPVDMLRSYVLEAMWSGGTIVVRGIPPGRSIKDFFTEDLRQLIYGKGASANISLDPRLFESYGIEAVPAIVYTEDRSQLSCAGVKTNTVVTDGKEMNYESCLPVSPDKYWKMSGAVTSDYALRMFEEKGATGAKVFHNALRKGMAPGLQVPKGQQAFSGDWKEAISPDDIMQGKKAIEEARQKQLQAQQTPSASK